MMIQTLAGPLVAVTRAPSKNDLDEILALPSPPLTKLALEDIHVRRCRLAGDRVDAHGGCFRAADLEKLLQLTHGAPALIGHDRRSLAVARFFGGTIEPFDGGRYIVPKFYWPRHLSSAEDLRWQIDAGILTEASIAFTFETPTCSICGRDIRDCEHEIGQEYGGRDCFYYYDGVDRVLEGSFVYRGAEPGTGFMNMRLLAGGTPTKKSSSLTIKINGRTYEALLQ
ncbi:MAG: hypothetical protein FJY66_03900 [Calditrichaeota bacterium]|nr:hypothetical protein [Calditrichota bacterium]